MTTLATLSVVTAQPAAAVTCSSPTFTWTASATVTKYPGAWCLEHTFSYYYKLSFTSNGDLALYGNQGKVVWHSLTAPFGNALTFNTRALVSVRGCPSENGIPTCKTLWNSKAETGTMYKDWDKFEIQIGVGLSSMNACWTVSAHSRTYGWFSSGIAFPSSAGMCTGTLEANGGSNGEPWEPV